MGKAATLALRHHGILLDACQEVDDFIRAANTGEHGALVIDWNLRTCEGTELCARLRDGGETRPIVILSGKLDAEHGREIAEAAGADAYIEKPATAESMACRIKALLRSTETRLRTVPRAASTFRCAVRSEGSIVTIELCEDRVILTNHVVHLRRKEFELFKCLLERAGQVVSKEKLLRLIWGSRATPSTSIVETSMSRLRTHLGSAASIIETVRGGYRISVEPVA